MNARYRFGLGAVALASCACSPRVSPGDASTDTIAYDALPDTALADATLPDATLSDASADTTELGDVAEIDAAPTVRCTGPFREVERTTVDTVNPRIPASIVGDGSLWFVVDRGSQTGTGSWDGLIAEARGWGGAASAAYVVPPFPTNSFETEFIRSNSGTSLGLLRLSDGRRLVDLRSRAVMQPGADVSLGLRLIVWPAETWGYTVSPSGVVVERYAPMTTAPAAPPARLGTIPLPSMPSANWRLHPAPNGQRIFAFGFANTPQAFARVFDRQMRPLSDTITIALPSADFQREGRARATNAGLWSLTLPAQTLRFVDNAGRARVVTTLPPATFSGPKIEAATDDFIVLQTDTKLEVRSTVDGSVMQEIPDAQSATLHEGTLFVFGMPLRFGGPDQISIRRMVCN